MAATIPATLVRELRERTGVGFMECKAALAEANGDLDRAITLLREKGLASASKKMGRVASDGLVVSYIHGGGK
ncbi:MAG TPA: elongation factor Ts, partial [Candidatus Methylomirabilis sp.]|nr:elongation factor Ts [Candidatus Methylomirabilis sp.]